MKLKNDNILSVLSVVMMIKMSEAAHEVTHGHHFKPCEDGVDQLACPGDRQCIHKQKVRKAGNAIYFVAHLATDEVCIAHACTKD